MTCTIRPFLTQSVRSLLISNRKMAREYTVESTIRAAGKEYVVPTGLFINNLFVKSKAEKTFPVINPFNGETLCSVSEAFAEDVDVAVR
jgi:hypothetical protein